MDRRLFALNTILAIVDTLIAALAILAFAWGSRYFERWWMLLFTIVPLILFNTHTLVLETPTEGGEKDAAEPHN